MKKTCKTMLSLLLALVMALSLSVSAFAADPTADIVYKGENALLHQKLEKRLLGQVNKLITTIAEDGIRQGIMHTEYPAEAIEMIMTYSYIAFDSMNEYTKEEEMRKIMGFVYHSERVLGMEKGSLLEAMKPLFNM